jgi:hypothetical protein
MITILKGDKMKTKSFIIILLLFHLFALGQSKKNEIQTFKLSNLDTILIKIISHHKDILKERDISFEDSTIIVLTIMPTIDKAMGVPQRIIDSIYNNNEIPLKADSPIYDIVVETRPFNSLYFNSTNLYPFKFYYNYWGQTVLILSILDIKFNCDLNKYILNIVPITQNSKDFDMIDNYTTYRITSNQIYEVITKKL